MSLLLFILKCSAGKKILKLTCRFNLILETEGKIYLLVTFIRFITQSKLSLIFTETLLFPYKTEYFLNDRHDSCKNADGKSDITRLILLQS